MIYLKATSEQSENFTYHAILSDSFNKAPLDYLPSGRYGRLYHESFIKYALKQDAICKVPLLKHAESSMLSPLWQYGKLHLPITTCQGLPVRGYAED
jgi:hypothetical protein